MKVLVVGGSGLIGGEAALQLHRAGHDVVIMSRTPPQAPDLAALDYMQGDYISDPVADGRLRGFDALVFSAAADIRNLPQDGSETPEAFYTRANDVAVPRFYEPARDAGIGRAVYIGSFYSHVAPHRIGECPYVTSRYHTANAVAALADDSFRSCCLNAPFVLGAIPGALPPHLAAMVQYAAGALPGMPVFAPRGGTNHITARALAQAVEGALEAGEPGRQYLVGDANYSWKAYLELWFDAVGNPQDLEVRDDEHPLLPNAILFAGAGATVSYEPDPVETGLLAYDRGGIPEAVADIVAACRAQ